MYHFVQYLAATAIVVVVIPGGIGMIVCPDWWKRLGDEVLATCIERYNSVC